MSTQPQRVMPTFPTPPTLVEVLTEGLVRPRSDTERIMCLFLGQMWQGHTALLQQGALRLPATEYATCLPLFFSKVGAVEENTKAGAYNLSYVAALDTSASVLLKALLLEGATLSTVEELEACLEATLNAGWPRTHEVLLKAPTLAPLVSILAKEATWPARFLEPCFSWTQRDVNTVTKIKMHNYIWHEGDNEDAWAHVIRTWQALGCDWRAAEQLQGEAYSVLGDCSSLPVLGALLQCGLNPTLPSKEGLLPPDIWRGKHNASHAASLVRCLVAHTPKPKVPESEEQRFARVGDSWTYAANTKTSFLSLLRQHGFKPRLTLKQADALLRTCARELEENVRLMKPLSLDGSLQAWSTLWKLLKKDDVYMESLPNNLTPSGTNLKTFSRYLVTQKPGSFIGTPFQLSEQRTVCEAVATMVMKPFLEMKDTPPPRECLEGITKLTGILALDPLARNTIDRAALMGLIEQHAPDFKRLLTQFWLGPEIEQKKIVPQNPSSFLEQAVHVWNAIQKETEQDFFDTNTFFSLSCGRRALFEAWLDCSIRSHADMTAQECLVLALACSSSPSTFSSEDVPLSEDFKQAWCTRWCEHVLMRAGSLVTLEMSVKQDEETTAQWLPPDSTLRDRFSLFGKRYYPQTYDQVKEVQEAFDGVVKGLEGDTERMSDTFWTVWRHLYFQLFLDLRTLIKDEIDMHASQHNYYDFNKKRAFGEKAFVATCKRLLEMFEKLCHCPEAFQEKSVGPVFVTFSDPGDSHDSNVPKGLVFSDNAFYGITRLFHVAAQRLACGAPPSAAWVDAAPLLQQPGAPLAPLLTCIFQHTLKEGEGADTSSQPKRRVRL